MKKIIYIFLFSLIFCLIGCGNTSSLSDENKEHVYETVVKTEEEEKEPEAPVTETGVVNTPETPCGAEDDVEETKSTEDFILPDIEDYFSGENFFDLEGYLIACGAECIGDSDSGYIASFPNWDIIIGSKTYSDFPKLAIENNVEVGREYYYIPPGDYEPAIQFFHEVNNGIEICDTSIYKLPDLIYGLYEKDFAPENPQIYGFVYD